MLYFLKKAGKIGAPVSLRRLEALPPNPQFATPITYYNYFKITTYYLILE